MSVSQYSHTANTRTPTGHRADYVASVQLAAYGGVAS
jgi:hypothetical protein